MRERWIGCLQQVPGPTLGMESTTKVLALGLNQIWNSSVGGLSSYPLNQTVEGIKVVLNGHYSSYLSSSSSNLLLNPGFQLIG